MPTTNLSITSYTWANATTLDCIVNSIFPLYIGNLLITKATDVGGRVNPGTRDQPGLRTIYIPSADAIFNKTTPSAPFTYPVTYASGTFNLQSAGPANPP